MIAIAPSLNGAIMTVGDFVIANRRQGSSVVRSVCVIREVEQPAVQVSWYLTPEELRKEGYLELPNPLSVEDYGNLVKCRVKEVCEICSVSSASISVNDVVDLAFVFHADTLEKEYVNCAGMIRVFFTRYRCQRDGRLVLVTEHAHAPFSRYAMESFPSRIWFFILDVKHTVEKMFSDTRQYQCCRKMEQLKCSLECWLFFCFVMNNSGAVVVHFNRRYTEKHLYCDLSLCSAAHQKYLQLIRLDTTTAMNCARNLFGLTFGLGSRNRAPKKGDSAVRLHHGDIVNVVAVEDRNAAADRFVEFVGSQGIDFIFDRRSRTVKIRARYSSCLAQNNNIRELLHLENDNLPAARELNRDMLSTVVQGTYFMRDDVLLQVVAVDGNNVIVEEAEHNFNHFSMDINEAAQLINEYIN
jgi:hypothetical protein